jgi:hypothetical protein
VLAPELWWHVLSFTDEENLARIACVSAWMNTLAGSVVLRPMDEGEELARAHLGKTSREIHELFGSSGVNEPFSQDFRRRLRERVEQMGNRYRHLACPVQCGLEGEAIQALGDGRRWQHVRLEIEGDLKLGQFLHDLKSSLGKTAKDRSFSLFLFGGSYEENDYALQPFLETGAGFCCTGFTGPMAAASSDLLAQLARTQALRTLALHECPFSDALAALETGSDRLQQLLLEHVPQNAPLDTLYAMLARKTCLRELELIADEEFDEEDCQGPGVTKLMNTGVESLRLALFTFSDAHFANCAQWMAQANSLRSLSFIDCQFVGDVSELVHGIRNSRSLKELELVSHDEDPPGLVARILQAVSDNISLESLILYVRRTPGKEAALQLLKARRPELKINVEPFYRHSEDSEDSAASFEIPEAWRRDANAGVKA